MKYSFNPKEFIHWKARITERIAEHYISDIVISKLKKAGWNHVFLVPGWSNKLVTRQPRNFLEVESRFYISCGSLVRLDPEKALRKFFSDNFLSPSDELLKRFQKLHELLETHPDFFLIKVKRTQARRKEEISVVDGEIEVVEVKSDKTPLPPHQKRSYGKIIREGYVLRFINVDTISFEENEFEIEEKLLTSPDDLKTLPLKGK